MEAHLRFIGTMRLTEKLKSRKNFFVQFLLFENFGKENPFLSPEGDTSSVIFWS